MCIYIRVWFPRLLLAHDAGMVSLRLTPTQVTVTMNRFRCVMKNISEIDDKTVACVRHAHTARFHQSYFVPDSS